MDKYGHAVVITKKEDAQIRKAGFNKTLPDNESIENRYKLSGIEVISVEDQDLKKIKLRFKKNHQPK